VIKEYTDDQSANFMYRDNECCNGWSGISAIKDDNTRNWYVLLNVTKEISATVRMPWYLWSRIV